MEVNNNFKLYYILPAAVLIIIIATILLLPKKTAPPQISPTPTAQMPMLIPTLSYSQPTGAPSGQVKKVTPTLIPVDYTGAAENQHLPQAEEDLANQKSTLRKKLPLAQPTFTITFDYANDQFLVTLNEPKQTNKTLFNQWLQTNYPAIPIDRFTFK